MEEQAKVIFRRIFARLKPPPEMRLSDWADAPESAGGGGAGALANG